MNFLYFLNDNHNVLSFILVITMLIINQIFKSKMKKIIDNNISLLYEKMIFLEQDFDKNLFIDYINRIKQISSDIKIHHLNVKNFNKINVLIDFAINKIEEINISNENNDDFAVETFFTKT